MIDALLSFLYWIGIMVFYLTIGTLFLSFVDKNFDSQRKKDKWK